MSYRQGKTKPLPGAKVNWGHPLAEGLIGCWNLNDGGSIAYDVTGRYGNGTLTGTTVKPTFESGAHGRQLSLTAANNQYVNIPHNPAYVLSSGGNGGFDDRRNHISYQVKFYMNSLRNFNGLFTKTTTNSAKPFEAYVLADGTLRAHFGQIGINPVTTLAAGVWYDMIVVQSWGPVFPLMTIYFDNGNIFTSSAIDWTTDTGRIMIGNRDDEIVAMDGKFSYCRLWNRSLTVSDVRALYDEPYCFMSSPSPDVRRFALAAAGGSGKAYYYAQTQGLR